MAVRTKMPASKILTAKEALKAFDKMTDYRRLSDNARSAALGYTGGTASQRKHYERYEEYSLAADAWEAAVREWLSGIGNER